MAEHLGPSLVYKLEKAVGIALVYTVDGRFDEIPVSLFACSQSRMDLAVLAPFPCFPERPPHRGMVCRAVWREDGLTSLEAETEGGCTTVPLTFSGDHLEVNAWTRFGGEIRVELAEPTGAPLPGRALADCDPLSGDALWSKVTWQGQADLSPWAGRPMRLRLALRRARLHALRFR